MRRNIPINYIKNIFLVALALVFSCQFALAQEGARGMSGYKLGPGDRISIHVFGEEDLSFETVLSDASTISYPFLGELAIKGKTVGELEQYIIDGLKGPYLVDPKVNITIVEYRQFYIQGEVKNSGGYPYQPGLTLRKAITLAGGFTERASKTKIFVVRQEEGTTPQPIQLDDLVFPGDAITVEQSFF